MRNETDILIYQTEDGNTKIDVRLEHETVWMTQKAIAELYQTSPQNITLHIKNIYEEAELQEEATCKYYLQVQSEGSREVNERRNIIILKSSPQLVIVFAPIVARNSDNGQRSI